jgi:predicted ATPase
VATATPWHPGVILDAEVFEAEANAADSAQGLRTALARWTGEPYADLGEWAPAELERTRLAELYDRALERCLALEIEAGEASGCIAELETMVDEKPLRERRWFLLMMALSRDARVADALHAYQRARKVFAAELGIDPGPELRTLEEKILLADVADAPPGNLPRQLTSLVGRERDVVQLADLVRERSLVTLTGVGGVGKTRLALAVAADVRAEFRDGAWLCELGPVDDPGALWQSVAASLGVPPSPGRDLRHVALEYLRLKRLLLVLDNCEHLLPTVSHATEAIVQACPGIVVLATSRERLAVSGEEVLPVSPLPVPSVDATLDELAQNEAVQLFTKRAHEVNHAFGLVDHNATAVAELCRQLDGLPLAIELAAARVRSLSPDDLVARIDDRFRVLAKGSHSGPERHHTLRKTIDWSYSMLTDNEQRALNRLSVFAGGCDLASAEAVLGTDGLLPLDIVDLLSELVDKSLVEVDATDGQGRYRLLETIRQYARERLEAAGEAAPVRGRHPARYVGLAEEAEPHLRGRDVYEWAAVLSRETDNFRAALEWAVEAERADEALRMVVALTVGPTSTGWTQTDWVEIAISIPGASQHQLYPAAAASAAMVAALRVDFDRAATLVTGAQEAQTRVGTHHVRVHIAAGMLAMFQGNIDQAKQDAQMAVDLARANQDPELAAALTLFAATLQPDRDKVVVVAEEAVRVARNANTPSGLLYAVFPLAGILAPEQPARADALLVEAVGIARKLGDRWAAATALSFRAGIAMGQEDWQRALRMQIEAAERDLELGGSSQLGATFLGASITLAQLQFLEPAAILAGFVDTRFTNEVLDQESFEPLRVATEQLLLDGLGLTQIAELKARGARLSDAEAVVYLRSQHERSAVDDAKHLGTGASPPLSPSERAR